MGINGCPEKGLFGVVVVRKMRLICVFFCRLIFVDEEIEDVLRESFQWLLSAFSMELQSDGQVTLVRLAMELVLNGVKSRVFSCVMLPIAFEELVAGLQGLLRKEAHRKGRELEGLPCVKKELVHGDGHVVPAIQLCPLPRGGVTLCLELVQVDGGIRIDANEQSMDVVNEALVDFGDARKSLLILKSSTGDVAGV